MGNELLFHPKQFVWLFFIGNVHTCLCVQAYNRVWNFFRSCIACIIISHQFIRIISTIRYNNEQGETERAGESNAYALCKLHSQLCSLCCVTLFFIGLFLLRAVCYWMKNNRWRINDPFCYETIEEKKSRPFSSRVLNICRYRIQCNTHTYVRRSYNVGESEHNLIHSVTRAFLKKLNVFNCWWIWRKTRLMQAFWGCNWLWIIAMDFFHIVIIIRNMEIINSRSNPWCTTWSRPLKTRHGRSIANHHTINCNSLTLLCHLKRWIFRFTSAVTYENSTRLDSLRLHVLGAVMCLCLNVSCFSTYDTLNAYVFIRFCFFAEPNRNHIDWLAIFHRNQNRNDRIFAPST